MQVLDGIRVIEWTEAMAGPYCAMLLGDFGADVIKVERPEVGDQSRGWGPPFIGSESAYFLCANRNKRSLTLNLDHPRTLEIMRRLLTHADIFIHNQPRPDSLVKRGLDYETLSAANPRLIYCAISGYGSTGPKVGLPGYDILAQGEAGVMSFTGDANGEPMRYPIAIADVTCGIYSAIGILAALFARERTGRGQRLDMALLDSQLTWLANIGSSYLNAGELPKRHGNAHPNIVPYQLFRTNDDRHIMVAVGTETIWKRFCQVLGIERTLARDPRYNDNRSRIANREALIPALQEIFLRAPADEWLEKFRQANVPAGPIYAVDEAINAEQAQARQVVVELEHPTLGLARSIANPIHMSATPVRYRCAPPLLGEHTDAILAELGSTQEEIRNLRAERAV
ncbi:MAG TPA: CaiB/BaiF CoA-transferase family protein [Terriglobales bacterium]|nr:CaiB/BaiF CoA-transferase family protein [Terriglobales bacterium]